MFTRCILYFYDKINAEKSKHISIITLQKNILRSLHHKRTSIGTQFNKNTFQSLYETQSLNLISREFCDFLDNLDRHGCSFKIWILNSHTDFIKSECISDAKKVFVAKINLNWLYKNINKYIDSDVQRSKSFNWMIERF